MSNSPDNDLPENVVLRPGSETDDDFIYSSWLKSYKRQAGPIPYRWYYKLYQQLLDRLYKRPAVRTTVACFGPNPDQIFGYIIHEDVPEQGTHVHYLYVKVGFRGMYIGTNLLETTVGTNPFVYTFRPRRHRMFTSRGGSFSDHFIRSDLES